MAPRPIGWVSTRGQAGDNLAPYSFFNAVAYVPPQVMFASTGGKEDRGRGKDTVAQVLESEVFCVNIATGDLREEMNATSAALPAGTSELEAAGLTSVPCQEIDCLRVADAAAALECRLTRVVELPGQENLLVLGEVVGVHLREDCVVEGRFDARPAGGWLARLGYRDYTVVTETFPMQRPG